MATGGEYHFWLKLKDGSWQKDVFLKLKFGPGKGPSVHDRETGKTTVYDGYWEIGPAGAGWINLLAHETSGFWKRQQMGSDCQIACEDSENWAFVLENAPKGYYDFKTITSGLVVLHPRNIAGRSLTRASKWKRVQ